MLRKLPPISTLNALVAVARYQSFTKAAMALNVTQSAVSHQIKLIEDLWGVKLFERTGHGIATTDAGKRLAELTREYFERIGQTLDDLRVVSSHETLRIDTLQSFAVKWLVPRLRHFDELYPNIDVWISTHDQFVDFSANAIDIAIRLGDGRFPGMSHDAAAARGSVSRLHAGIPRANGGSRIAARSAPLSVAAAPGRAQPYELGGLVCGGGISRREAEGRHPFSPTPIWHSRPQWTVSVSHLPARPMWWKSSLRAISCACSTSRVPRMSPIIWSARRATRIVPISALSGAGSKTKSRR
jgi:DNA-binding transcriptional LysR family regulator